MQACKPTIGEMLANDPQMARELLSKALDASDALVAVSTLPEGDIVTVNDAFLRKTGWSRDEAIGTPSRRLTLFDDVIKRGETLKVLIAQGSVRCRETEILTRDGRILKGLLTVDTITLQGKEHLLTVFNDLTETLTFRDALKTSEERYRLLAEASPEMIYLLDGDGVVRYVNSAACARFGTAADQVIGRSVRELYPPDMAERHLRAIGHVMQSGQMLNTELQEQFPTGPCWIDARLSPVRDEEGKITGVLGLSQDISGRKRAEERSRAQYELGLVLSGAPSMEQGLSLCLETALRVSGMDAGGIYLTEPGSGDLVLQCHRNLSAAFVASAGRFAPDSPSGHVANAGLPVYALFSQIPAPRFDGRDEEGLRAVAVLPFKHEDRVIGSLNLASHTLDTVAAEVRTTLEIVAVEIGNAVGRLRAEEAVRDSEERLRTVFEQVPAGMAIAGRDLRFVRVNLALCAMLGREPADLAGRSLYEMAIQAPAVPDPQQLSRLAAGEVPALRSQGRYGRKDGSTIWADLTISALRGQGGRFLHFLVMLEDMTQRRKMEEELQRTQRLESLGVLAGGIAHDFNNLLAGLFGFVDLARLSLDPSQPAYEYLSSAMLAFERASALSRQLLTFAKGGAPVKSLVSIAQLLRDSASLALSGSSAKCEFAVASDLHRVEADPHQLSQVFSNLLINARQAMPDGGLITIAARNQMGGADADGPMPHGPCVQITITDQGMGIAADVIHRVFDPFFTTKPDGSGLGLAISYSIVKRHHGRISVQSQPGAGATFTILLPAAAGEGETPAPPAQAAAAQRGSGRILIMDDEPALRRLSSAVLSSAGYEVTTVPHGEAAVEAFTTARNDGHPFDLVILDMTIVGGMGGERTIAALKRIDPGLRACVSSGHAQSDVLENFAAHGFRAMIRKPYRAVDLLQAVKAAMGGDR